MRRPGWFGYRLDYGPLAGKEDEFFGVFYNSPHGILSKILAGLFLIFLEQAIVNYCDGVIFFLIFILKKGYKTRFFELLFSVTA